MPSGVINQGDGLARYAQTKALLLRRSVSIPPDLAHTKKGELIYGISPGPNGRLYSKYGIGTSLLWLIPAALAWLVHRLTAADFDLLAGFAISFVNPVIVAATAWSIAWALRRLGASRNAQIWSVLLYIFGASTLAYANTALSEPLVGLLLFWACVLPVVMDDWRAGVIAGVLAGACMYVKPELALLPACLLPLFIGKPRRGALVAFCVTAAVAGTSLCLDNLIWRGSMTRFGYGQEAFQFGSPSTGLIQEFFGINRNILLFNPALILAIAGWVVVRSDHRWQRLLMTCLLAWILYLPLYASWHAWDGGMSFGPRFVHSFAPLTLLPSGVAFTKLATQARRAIWARGALSVLCVAALALVPLQIAGMSIKDEQAVDVSSVTGISEPDSHVKLLALKLRRGIRHPEIYRSSDFAQVPRGDIDAIMDYRSKPTFQYLNHWWSIYLAYKVRYGRPVPTNVPSADGHSDP